MKVKLCGLELLELLDNLKYLENGELKEMVLICDKRNGTKNET